MQSTLWDVYRHGETVGIRTRLDSGNTMREAGYSRTLIHLITQVPEANLALWEEAQPNEESDIS